MILAKVCFCLADSALENIFVPRRKVIEIQLKISGHKLKKFCGRKTPGGLALERLKKWFAYFLSGGDWHHSSPRKMIVCV